MAGGLLEFQGNEIAQQVFSFQTPPKEGPMRLSISYARQPGFVRIEGRLWIQSVQTGNSAVNRAIASQP